MIWVIALIWLWLSVIGMVSVPMEPFDEDEL